MADPYPVSMSPAIDSCKRMPAKSWGTWNEALTDHRMFLTSWPKIFDAYVGPNALSPFMIEAAMVAVNSVNSCSF